MAAEQSGNLRLDGLRQQRSRAVAQYLGQRTFRRMARGQPDSHHAIWTRSKNRCTQPQKRRLSASLKIRHVVSKAISLPNPLGPIAISSFGVDVRAPLQPLPTLAIFDHYNIGRPERALGDKDSH